MCLTSSPSVESDAEELEGPSFRNGTEAVGAAADVEYVASDAMEVEFAVFVLL
jgi:hypothetical protein